jgi:hypothetical protein
MPERLCAAVAAGHLARSATPSRRPGQRDNVDTWNTLPRFLTYLFVTTGVAFKTLYLPNAKWRKMAKNPAKSGNGLERG